MIDPEFIKIIQKIADEQGKEIFLEPSRFKSFLLDYTRNEFKKESKLLIDMLNADCAKYINSTKKTMDCKQRFVKRLEDELSISPAKSAEMLDVLFLVLRGDTVHDAEPTKLKYSKKDNNTKKDKSSKSTVVNHITIKTGNYHKGDIIVNPKKQINKASGKSTINTTQIDELFKILKKKFPDNKSIVKLKKSMPKNFNSDEINALNKKIKKLINDIKKINPERDVIIKELSIMEKVKGMTMFASNLANILRCILP